MLNYFLTDKADNQMLDFALEEDEEAMILTFVREELSKQQNAGF